METNEKQEACVLTTSLQVFTGVMRIAGCAPQPWIALWRVSLNMLRSSMEWQYTASILGHQSNAD